MLIDTPTAWSILCTPLGIAAGLGWIRCARMLAASDRKLKIAKDDAAHWRYEHDWVASQRDNSDSFVEHLAKQLQGSQARATDLEDRLRKIEQSRHNAAKVGRAAQLAQQSAAKEARRLELEQNVADRAAVKIRRVA
jgi:hypothetical protein